MLQVDSRLIYDISRLQVTFAILHPLQQAPSIAQTIERRDPPRETLRFPMLHRQLVVGRCSPAGKPTLATCRPASFPALARRPCLPSFCPGALDTWATCVAD